MPVRGSRFEVARAPDGGGKRTAMLKQFREFALKGNVVDLAVGVIIGAAFGNIVSSLVSDIFTPIIGAVTGGLDFSNHFIPLSANVTADSLEAARRQGAVIAYGRFLTLVINFMIVAWILFFVVRAMNTLKHAEAAKPAPPTRSEILLAEIRDLLTKSMDQTPEGDMRRVGSARTDEDPRGL